MSNSTPLSKGLRRNIQVKKDGRKWPMTCITKIPISSWLLDQIEQGLHWLVEFHNPVWLFIMRYNFFCNRYPNANCNFLGGQMVQIQLIGACHISTYFSVAPWETHLLITHAVLMVGRLFNHFPEFNFQNAPMWVLSFIFSQLVTFFIIK